MTLLIGQHMVDRSKDLIRTKGKMGIIDCKTSSSVKEQIGKQKAHQFFLENSTIMPGYRDKVSVKTIEGRECRQKRLLHCNLNELYALFKIEMENCSDPIVCGFSTFAKCRPPECILPGGSGTHSVCVCSYHENVALLLRSVKLLPIFRQRDIQNIIDEFFLCEHPTIECYSLNCSKCPDLQDFESKVLKELFEFDMEEIRYKNWTKIEGSSYYQLTDIVKSCQDFCEELGSQINNLLYHEFIHQKQREHLQSLKTNSKPNEAIIHADFSENLKVILQNEIQSHYYRRKQITIHPFCVYYRQNGIWLHRSIIMISPVLTHNYVLVHAFNVRLFKYLKENLPQIDFVQMYTDGAASQYKNRFNFVNLSFAKEDLGLHVCWNFHATSHGKCACDGLGGTVKRSAIKYNLSNPDSPIRDAVSLYNWAKVQLSKNMHFEYVDEVDYQRSETVCSPRMTNTITIEGTQKLHSFIPMENMPYTIETRHYSLETSSTVVELKNIEEK